MAFTLERSRARVGRIGVLSLTTDTPWSLPLFALLLLSVIWGATLHLVERDRESAVRATKETLGELLDTYEAQVGDRKDSFVNE
ncbi:hypothetical protein [Massilia sp. DWR3-1-1]|uniref:hypothetical protein n=1 Tax=Massilia sp. DWR3-1-1 TaxID=2804559 RepID=UPI003CFA0A36